MKKRYKIFIMLIIIHLILTFFLNTHVSAKYSSLEEFIEQNGMENMSGKEIETACNEVINKIEDEDQQNGIKWNASTVLDDFTLNSMKSDEERMSYLEKGFLDYATGDSDGNVTAADLYYGYMFGSQWLTYKKNIKETEENTSEGKTVAQQFDEKYNEYKNLKEEEKDINTLNAYKSALQTLYNQLPKEDQTEERLLKLDEVDTAVIDTQVEIDKKREEEANKKNNGESTAIYQYPEQDKKKNSAGSLDDMIGDADKFIDSTDETAISSDSLQSFSKTYYNIFLTIGIVVATLVGAILGIKFMIGGAEEKANVKELLLPYIAGCIIIFGAFAIWKLVVTILSNSLT